MTTPARSTAARPLINTRVFFVVITLTSVGCTEATFRAKCAPAILPANTAATQSGSLLPEGESPPESAFVDDLACGGFETQSLRGRGPRKAIVLGQRHHGKASRQGDLSQRMTDRF